MSLLLAPYFNFRSIIKSECLPTSSVFVQRWQYSRGKFVFNSDSADVACLLFGSCFLCVFAYKVVASATVGKIGNCLLYFIISLPRDFPKRRGKREAVRKGNNCISVLFITVIGCYFARQIGYTFCQKYPNIWHSKKPLNLLLLMGFE